MTPARLWWTTAALADAGLPDVPGSRQGVEAMAAVQGWRAQPEVARRREGRGGGWEYHWSVLPARAKAALLKAAAAAGDGEPDLKPRMDRDAAWAWFEGLPETCKEVARARLAIIRQVESLSVAIPRHVAITTVAQAERAAGRKAADRTIWGWLALIEGVDVADRLPYLAPRHRAAAPVRERAACSPEFLDQIRADYLRLGGPSLKSAHRRVVSWCQAKGLAYLEYRTALRWIDDNVPRVTQVFAREGEKGLARCFPPQIRDRSTLTALEGVVADCHKIDVFVQWPGFDKPVRVHIVAFTDLFSNKVLAWKVDLDPNKVAVMSAFGELIETWGIPRHCLFDNGREFANKWLTGGTPTRFRFKVREDDALGVLPQMGIKIHWATPGHGQAKPIERTFRDFADDIARHPAFAGAYVGPHPMAKPEDYGSRAIPLADFLEVVEDCVREHNARPGRLTDSAKGRSFDETFAASYAQAKILKATPEQHRLWLMGQEVRKLHKHHGAFQMFENSYWSDWMNEFVGQSVVARFDPEDLHAGLYLYSLAGEFLGPAECRGKTGFFDLVGAKDAARIKRQRRAAEKRVLDLHRPVAVDQWAAELRQVQKPESPLVEAKVVEIARSRKPLIEREVPVPDTSRDAGLKVMQVDFSAVRPQEAKPQAAEIARFWRVVDIERRSKAGEPISAEDAEFWHRMQNHPVYLTQRDLYDQFGAKAIG